MFRAPVSLNTPVVLAIHVGTSGPRMGKDDIVVIAASLYSEVNNQEIQNLCVNLSPADGHTFDQRCLEEYWSKQNLLADVKINPVSAEEGIKQFAEFLFEAKSKYKALTMVSINPSYVAGWLNLYLSRFTDLPSVLHHPDGSYGQARLIDLRTRLEDVCLLSGHKNVDTTAKMLSLLEINPQPSVPGVHHALSSARAIAGNYCELTKKLSEYANVIANNEVSQLSASVRPER